ncbi:MAG: hypothetical protein EB023_11795 [Flavobacteriia bacterium]|nr:hypothetical protein [Flavobacteriia bacterium]
MDEKKNFWQQLGTALTTPGTEFQLPVKIPVELDKKTTTTIIAAAGILAGGLIVAALLNRKK